MKAQKFAGLGLLIAVALVIGGLRLVDNDDQPSKADHTDDIIVTGIIGQGKVAFFSDPDVQRILKDKYGLTVDIDDVVASNAQVNECVVRHGDLDFCWTSSQNAGIQIEEGIAPAAASDAFIFNSPIVMYTWGPIADALVAQGIVEKTGETYWIVDFPRLVQMVVDGTQWSDIGLTQLHGDITIYSTDPAGSNTGNSFAALLANTFNSGQVVDGTSVKTVTPQVKSVFDGMGLLPGTTATFFEQFLTQGMGAHPIIVAYESNLIEFSLQNQTEGPQALIRNEIRTLYPKPTIWSAQPVIAFTDGGERLMNALRDPEIQRIGWEEHGFRNGVASQPIDPSKVGVPGVPITIESASQMPRPEVMDQLIQGIQATPTDAIKQESTNQIV
jgi:hypothetical protein